MGKVQYLVIGLSEDETWPSSDEESGPRVSSNSRTQAETSATLVRALRVCTGLRHFQVRPLHDSCRDELLAALQETTLETLICSPRLRAPNVEWTGCLFQREDLIKLVLPSLRNFELDAWTTPRDVTPVGTPTSSVTPEPCEPIVMFSKLVTLRLRFDTCDAHLFALLASAGETLENADIYMERMVSIENGAEALSFILPSIKELRWTTNPPIEGFADINLSHVPLFDRILPNFEVLEKLSISATEVSPAILSLLPPSIRSLEVQAYTYRGPFKFEEQMITTLANQSIKFKLSSFTVLDSAESWVAEDVISMTEACLGRGIKFKFIPDEEGAETDSG